MKRKMLYVGLIAGVAILGTIAWTMTARAGYESAKYKVVESEGSIEIREYPDLVLAATTSQLDSQGRDGSFMRLFRYISGANDSEQKIAMTTPVFMEGTTGDSEVSMGFVMPKDVAEKGAPEPKGAGVRLRRRPGGRFAAIRFSGRLNSQLAREKEAELREWMNSRGLEGEPSSEAAGYDPPFTPGPFRRNEVLIRLNSSASNPQGATDE